MTLVGPIGNVWSVTREYSPKKTPIVTRFVGKTWSDYGMFDGVFVCENSLHVGVTSSLPAFPSSTLLDYMNDGKILAKIFLQVGTFPEIYVWHQLLKDKCSGVSGLVYQTSPGIWQIDFPNNKISPPTMVALDAVGDEFNSQSFVTNTKHSPFLFWNQQALAAHSVRSESVIYHNSSFVQCPLGIR